MLHLGRHPPRRRCRSSPSTPIEANHQETECSLRAQSNRRHASPVATSVGIFIHRWLHYLSLGKATTRALRLRPRPPYRLVHFSLCCHCCRFSGRLHQRLLPPCSSTVTVISHRDRVVVARECCLRGRSRPGSSRLRERTSFATKSIGVKPIITTSGHQSPPSASPATTAVAVSSAPIFCYILVTWNLFKLGCNHILNLEEAIKNSRV